MARIGIIENTGLQRIIIEKTLQSHGFDDLEAMNSHSMTFSTIESKVKDCQLILLDYDNRDLDWESIMASIRNLASKEELPVVIMTASSDSTTVKKVFRTGANDVLAKPFTDVKLMEKVFSNTAKPSIYAIKDVVEDKPADNKRYMMEWNKDFEIGVPTIDQEHKGLIERYETLYQKMRKGEGLDYYIELITFLQDYVDEHFTHEEAYQKEIDYPDYGSHHETHEAFKKDLAEIIQKQKDHQIGNTDLIRFNLFIKNWLTHHILVEDKKIGEYMKST